MPKGLKIGEISKKSGIRQDTIRFYEDLGLLNPKERSSSGYRYYDQDVLPRLIFIKNTQKLGFSLKEIKDLLDLKANKKAKAGQVKAEMRRKLAQVLQKNKNLNAIAKTIKKLILTCHREHLVAEECPILKSLHDFELNRLENKTLKEGGFL